MHRLQEKLLAVVLVLLLGLSPLQNALADITWSSGQEASASMTDCMHDEVAMAGDQSNHACGHCDTDQTCSNHACSSGHCASIGMAIVPTFSYPAVRTVVSKTICLKNSFESQNLSSLFRPPII